MPIRPSVAENIRYLQRQINQQGTGRFGPMSIGPGDGRLRFYATDGRVLFEADSTGASVESRGSLTAMTPLLDSIRAKDDDQDDALGQHGSRLGSAEGRIDTLHSRQNSADQLNAEQNGKLSQLRVDLKTQTTRIDNRATTSRVDGIDSRVGSAESSIASHGTRIGNAEGRLDNHAGRIGAVEGVNASQNSRLSQVEVDNNTQDGRLDNHAIQLGNLRDGKASVGSVNTAQSRADAAYSRASTGISDAATAKSRADAAHAKAASNEAKIEQIDVRLKRLENLIRD